MKMLPPLNLNHMKKILSLLLVLMSLNLYAQNPNSTQNANTQPFQTGYAVIKGHIENNKEPFFEMAMQGFLRQRVISIPVDKKGNFSKSIGVEGEIMDVIIEGMRRFIFVKNKDTLTCTWNAKAPDKTFKVSSRQPGITNNMRIQGLVDSLRLASEDSLYKIVYNNKAADSLKFKAINDLYNKEFDIISQDELNQGLMKIAVDAYFNYARLLEGEGLLSTYRLKLYHPNEKLKMMSLFDFPFSYAIESEEWFKSSRYYRDFLLNYLRLSRPIKGYSIQGDSVELKKKTVTINVPRREYDTGFNSLRITEIRDWYAANVIMNAFESYDHDEAVEIYKDFLTNVKTPYYADTIKQYYQNIKNLKPGMPAPEFTLKDEKGRQVSLSQFKGKTVFLDFWGVNCGPCMYDIKNEIPALHERYKNKNVVFINICVDSKEPVWKASLKTLKLDGVNLIAEGWNKHPTVKAYNVTGIPHYFLIDANGNLVDNNAPRPDPRMYDVLDKLVK